MLLLLIITLLLSNTEIAGSCGFQISLFQNSASTKRLKNGPIESEAVTHLATLSFPSNWLNQNKCLWQGNTDQEHGYGLIHCAAA